jgi:hypothetical protein
MTRCHSGRVLYSPVSLAFQLTLVAIESEYRRSRSLWNGVSVLTEKTNESDAILEAKHVFVFPSCPDLSGRPGAKRRSQGKQDSFWDGSRPECLCRFKKRRPGNLGRGTRTPLGLELPSIAAKRVVPLQVVKSFRQPTPRVCLGYDSTALSASTPACLPRRMVRWSPD